MNSGPRENTQLVVDPYCAMLHGRLWDEIIKFQKSGKEPSVSAISVDNQIDVTGECYESEIGYHLREWLKRIAPCEGKPKITVAGKNAASFDLPFLRARGGLDANVSVRHRVLDVTSHFYRPGDECLPDLNTCLARAEIAKATSHGALSDALLVCSLIDHVFSNVAK